MKRQLKIFGILVVAMVAIVCLGVYGVDGVISFLSAGTVMYAITPGLAVGPGTTHEGTLTSEEYKSEGLLEDDLNDLIVKVRPSDVPLDTLTREIGNVKRVERNECGGYEIGTRDIDDLTLAATDGLSDVANIPIGKKSMWQVSDTIFIPGVIGGGGKPLMLLVVGKDNAAGTLQVVAVNPVSEKIPVIASGSGLLRLGKAMSEIDAQTDAFSALPSSRMNYSQIHMTQIELSVLSELSKKKVNMDFSTHKELAIWDMKRAMEFTNLFGVKGMTMDPVKNKVVYTSDGLWNQLTRTSTYNQLIAPNNKFFVGLTKEIFDGNNGSERRVLLAGPDLIEYLSQIDAYSKQLDAKNVEVVHGVRFNRIITNFGELLVKSMSGLFVGDMSTNGMVLDMSYIVKYVFEPLQTKELDLDASGQRRVKAVRLLENYALFAENLDVHRKIRPA
jgi:hypothetical protein